MRTLAGWLLMVWLVSVGNGPAQAQSLPLSARADLLAQEIYTAVKHKQNALALEKIAAYRALEAEGHKTPPAVLFMEARLADKSNDPERSLKALEAYLAVAERSDRHYRDALALHGTLKDRLERKKAEEQQRRKDAAAAVLPDILKQIEQAMVEIPGGKFNMGSRKHDREKPIHTITIRPFRMSKYEVTFAQYDVFAADTGREYLNDIRWGRDDKPVINVDWNDATAFAQWLSQKTGLRYRLPSEAEWEYACRGGDARAEYCEGDDLDAVAWYTGNSGDKTQPVGRKRPNRFGLYDMSGNVKEWVQDCVHESYMGAPVDGSAWTSGGNCSYRMGLGSTWDTYAEYTLAANPRPYSTDYRFNNLGFRLAQDL